MLGEKWQEERGDMNTVIEKLKRTDKNFININLYSDSTKWGIIDELIKKNKT